MKKIASLILSIALGVTAMAGCSSTKEIDMTALANDLVVNVQYGENLTAVSSAIAQKRFGLSEDEVEETIAYAGTNAVVDEIAIFKTQDVKSVESKVNEHIEKQKESYASYKPDEVPKLDDCVIEVSGDYVILCVSENNSKARGVIENYTK